MNMDVEMKKITDFTNKSLLLVDDDSPFRERLARAMEKKGFQVSQAEGVKKGIEAVKASCPGFAVVDLRLGDGNGLEVVKELQKINSKSKIIMLTGYLNFKTNLIVIFLKLILSVFFIYLFGIVWLGILIGWEKPIFKLGFFPFIYAELFKILLLTFLTSKVIKIRKFI